MKVRLAIMAATIGAAVFLLLPIGLEAQCLACWHDPQGDPDPHHGLCVDYPPGHTLGSLECFDYEAPCSLPTQVYSCNGFGAGMVPISYRTLRARRVDRKRTTLSTVGKTNPERKRVGHSSRALVKQT
jgi:hypothetical protein